MSSRLMEIERLFSACSARKKERHSVSASYVNVNMIQVTVDHHDDTRA